MAAAKPDTEQESRPKRRLDARYLIAVPAVLLLCFGLGVQYAAYISGVQPGAVQAAAIRAVAGFDDTRASDEIIVQISGAVAHKGYYALGGDTTLRELLEFAGLKAAGDMSEVDLSRQPEHGDAYHIRSGDDPLDVTPWLTNDLLAASADAPEDLPLVDLNAASLEELQQLPGIGEVKAQAIIDYRVKHNGFRYKEELLGVEGIGNKIYEDIIDHVTV